MKQQKLKYANHSHQVILEALKGYTLHNPIMLTANQFDDQYTVSVGFTGTDVKINKSDVLESEIREIPEDLGYQFIINKVWEAK